MTGVGTISKTVGIFVAAPGLLFIYWFYYMRQKCYSWRSELCDPDFSKVLYRPLTPTDMIYCRRPHPDPEKAADFVDQKDNPGVMVIPEALSFDEAAMLKEEAKLWVDLWGRRASIERRAAQKHQLEEAGFTEEQTAFVDHQRYVSDRYEDPRPPKASWGCGDSIVTAQIPPLIRALATRYTSMFPNAGRLRHIYIEYSKTGEFYRRPRAPHSFDGHEYCIVPLTQSSGSVVTMTPTLRSKESELKDALKSSFSDQDLDFFLPLGSMMRVYSVARFRWAWGLRPGNYFGNPAQKLPLPENSPRLLLEQHHEQKKLESWLKTENEMSTELRPKKRQKSLEEVNSGELVPRAPRWWEFWKSQSTATGDTMAAASVNENGLDDSPHQAYLVLHFEGPVGAKKTRRRTTMWEVYAYGQLPKPEQFSWNPDLPITEKQVKEEHPLGILWWLAHNYRYMGSYS